MPDPVALAYGPVPGMSKNDCGQPVQAEALGSKGGVPVLARSIAKGANPLKAAPSHSAASPGRRRAHIMHSISVYFGEELEMNDSCTSFRIGCNQGLTKLQGMLGSQKTPQMLEITTWKLQLKAI